MPARPYDVYIPSKGIKQMNSLHLTVLGPNMTEVRIGTNYVLFSYQTPVAYSNEAGEVFKTDKKWSNTTGKHLSKWIGSRAFKSVPQGEIDKLIK